MSSVADGCSAQPELVKAFVRRDSRVDFVLAHPSDPSLSQRALRCSYRTRCRGRKSSDLADCRWKAQLSRFFEPQFAAAVNTCMCRHSPGSNHPRTRFAKVPRAGRNQAPNIGRLCLPSGRSYFDCHHTYGDCWMDEKTVPVPSRMDGWTSLDASRRGWRGQPLEA